MTPTAFSALRIPSLRRLGMAALFAVAGALVAAPSHAQQSQPERQAERFIRAVADEVLGLLYDRSLTPDARAEALKILLVERTDFRRLAGFMMGRYARALSKDERKEYLALLPEYASKVYFSRIGRLEKGVSLSLGQAQRKDAAGRQIIVPSHLTLPNKSLGEEPLAISWWVVFDRKTRQPKLFDISVEGVWFAQEQRVAFSSLIRRNGGRPSAAIAELRRRIAATQ